MLRAFSCRCDERKVNLGCRRSGKLLLCLLGCVSQSLKSHLISGKVYTLSLLELGNHPVRDALIIVITTKMGIAVCRQYLDDAITDIDDGNIERATAEIINHDLLLFFIIKAIRKCCSCRLVDDTLYIKTCDLTGILGSLSLGIIEICRNRDDSLCHLLTKISLGICLQLLKDHRGDFLRCIVLAIDGNLVISTHMSLDGRDRTVCICYSLTLRRITDESVAVLCKCHNRRCGSHTLCICDDGRLTTFHDGYAAVCRT